MRFLVVDGLLNVRQTYRTYIERLFPGSQIIDCISAEDALFAYFENYPDIIVISDVLSFRNAVELSGLLHQLNKKIPVIIVANDDSCAIDAIKNHCFDLLINPIPEEKFRATMLEAVEYIQSNVSNSKQENVKSTRVKLSEGRGSRLLDLDQIACFIADGTFSKIIFRSGDVDYSGYFLGKIEQLMPKYQFVRLHRSLLINMKSLLSIDKVKGTCLVELNESTLEFKVSKKQIKKLETENIL